MGRRGSYKKNLISDQLLNHHFKYINEEIQFHSDGTTSENGKVISYLWNFGDDTTSTEANPTHVYGEKGTYTVELTVKDSRGKEVWDTIDFENWLGESRNNGTSFTLF